MFVVLTKDARRNFETDAPVEKVQINGKELYVCKLDLSKPFNLFISTPNWLLRIHYNTFAEIQQVWNSTKRFLRLSPEKLQVFLRPLTMFSFFSKETVWDELGTFFGYDTVREEFQDEIIHESDIEDFVESQGATWIGDEYRLRQFAEMHGMDVTTAMIEFDIACVFLDGTPYYIAFSF